VTDPRFRTKHDSMGEVAVPARPTQHDLLHRDRPRRRLHGAHIRHHRTLRAQI
jgi:hypothetical protein